jgi:hypothetical protein
MGPLGESGDSWLRRSASGYMASRYLQGCSPRLCRLRTSSSPEKLQPNEKQRQDFVDRLRRLQIEF